MKNTPGSPVFQAPATILSNTSRASSLPVTRPVRGCRSSYFVPAATAPMNSSVTATEMLIMVI